MKYVNEAAMSLRSGWKALPALLLLCGLSLASVRAALAQAPTLVQFSQAVYEADEDQELGVVTVRVTRTGDLSGTSRVSYTTADGTATADEDYQPASGTLQFGPGDASAEFFIILGPDYIDSLIEPTETVRLLLRKPVNAGLGQPSESVLRIADTGLRTAPQRISFVYRGTTATIRWTDNSDNETRFRVQRRQEGSGFRTIATRPAGTTELVDTGLREGATYTYRVRAERDGLASAWSPEITFTIGESRQESFRLRVSKIRLEFGSVRVGRSKKQAFRVRNAGKKPLTVRVGGAAAPYQIVRGGGDTVLQPGETMRVVVRFAPTSRGRFQDRIFVAIVLRDGDLTGRNVRLNGRGR